MALFLIALHRKMAGKKDPSTSSNKPSVDWGKVVGTNLPQRDDSSLSGLKVKGHRRKKGQKRKRRGGHSTPSFEKGKSKRSSRSLTAPLFLSGFLLLGAFILAGYWFLQKQSNRPTLSQRTAELPLQSQINDHRQLEVKPNTIYDLPPARVAQNFALSDSFEERLKWVRNPEIIRSQRDHYDPSALNVPASIIKSIGAFGEAKSKYYSYAAVFPSGNRRVIAVIGTDEGPRVDFDAYAALHSHPWEDIIAGKVKSARVRVSIEPSRYNVRAFQDLTKWSAYRMTTEWNEGVLYGYIEKASELDLKLQAQARKGKTFPMLDLKIDPADIKNKQVLITGIPSENWIEDQVTPLKGH